MKTNILYLIWLFSSQFTKKSKKSGFKTSLAGLFIGIISGGVVHIALANTPPHPPLVEMQEMVVLDSEGEPHVAFGPINLFDLSDPLLEPTPIKDDNPAPHNPEESGDGGLDSTFLEKTKKTNLAHNPYYYPYPIFGNVCRYGLSYCYTVPLPVGATCSCYTFGFLWFVGSVSTW